jgi:hypothetical protein
MNKDIAKRLATLLEENRSDKELMQLFGDIDLLSVSEEVG